MYLDATGSADSPQRHKVPRVGSLRYVTISSSRVQHFVPWYDAYGNCVATTNELGEVVERTYDAEGRVLAESGGTYPLLFGYDSDGRRTSYSANGELVRTRFGAPRYDYDAESRLSAVVEEVSVYPTNSVYTVDVLVVSNRYDHLGRRVQKITPEATHTYFYDGWFLVKEVVERSGDTRRCGVSPRRHGGAGSSTSLGEDSPRRDGGAGSSTSLEEDSPRRHGGAGSSTSLGKDKI